MIPVMSLKTAGRLEATEAKLNATAGCRASQDLSWQSTRMLMHGLSSLCGLTPLEIHYEETDEEWR